MKNRFLTHFTITTVLHGLLLAVGSYTVANNVIQENKVVIPKLGNGIMKMKVASGLFLAQPKTQPQVVAKPVEKKIVTNKISAKPVEVKKPVEATPPVVAQNLNTDSSTAQGSPEGTGGRADGFAFGSGNGKGKFSVRDLYIAELRAKIDQNKYYPPMSRRLGQTGTVVIAFTLLEDGNIVDVRIHKPSQFERLNVSALDAVKKVERFKPIPKETGDNKIDIKVPVKFVTI